MKAFQAIAVIFAVSIGCIDCQQPNENHPYLFKNFVVPCEDNSTCTVLNSYCNLVQKQCQCVPDFVSNEDSVNWECLPKVKQIYEKCDVPAQCEGLEHTQCVLNRVDNERQCLCIITKVPSLDLTSCLPGHVLIGETCEEPQQCVGVESSSSDCASSVCACNSEWVSNRDRSDCLPVVNTLRQDSCFEAIQCHRGEPGIFSECVYSAQLNMNTCNCNVSAVNLPQEHVCHPKALIVGDACKIDPQCEAGLVESRCNLDQEKCECKSNAIPSSNMDKCLLKMQLDQPCNDTTQCADIGNAHCSPVGSEEADRVCSCNSDHIQVGTNCLPLTSVIGGLCDHDFQCSQLDAVCNSTTKTCECNDDKIETSTKCLNRVPNLDGFCNQTIQCQVSNTQCISTPPETVSRCKCVPDEYVESETLGRCVQIIHDLNQKCDEDIQCIKGIGNLSECADGVCQCKGNYGYYNGHCYIPAKLDQICHSLEECQVGVNHLAFCQVRCRCQSGTIRFDEKCYLNKTVGDPCESNIECTVGIHGQVQCDGSTKTCKCGLGYSPDPLNKVCTSGSTPNFQFSLYMCVVMLIMSSVSFKNSL